MDVCVDRDHELGGCDRPEAEVDAIGGANHPSRVENEALARAAGARIADQVTLAAAGRIAAERIRKPGQAFPEVSVACAMKVGEGLADGFVLAKQAAGPTQHRREMLSPINAMDEPPKEEAEFSGVCGYDGGRRFGTQGGEHAIDASSRGHRVSERQAGRDEPHDLLVAGLIVAVDEIDGVSATGRLRVRTSKQCVQAFADTVHFAVSCYIAEPTAMTTSSLPKRGLCLISILLVIALGCARDSSGAQGTTAQAADGGTRLNLGIRLSDGRWLELADLRGTPVLLFVFATFDAVSQASLKSLRPFVPQHPEVIVIGVAAQPRAAQLVEAWAYALDPPFVVGTDPYGSVENGESSIGKIETVPTYILYDANGYEIDRTTGLLTEGDLAQLVKPVSEAQN